MTDFHYVPARQDAIHYRLEDWARWVTVYPQPWRTHPMFRQYRSHAWQWERPEIKAELNPIECLEVERAVCLLPESNRSAIRWCYVFYYIPVNAIRRDIGVTRDGLGELILMGRDMLTNRLLQRIAEKV